MRLYDAQVNSVKSYLSKKESAVTKDIASLLALSPERARAILSRMREDGILSCKGGNKNRTYQLS